MKNYLVLGLVLLVSGCTEAIDPLDPTSTTQARSDGNALAIEPEGEAESAALSPPPVLRLNSYSSGYDEKEGTLLDFTVGSGPAMAATTIEVSEGYQARLILQLTDTVTTATTIPVTAFTVRPPDAVWRVHNYDWTHHTHALDYAVTPSSGFHFAANTDTASLMFSILDDSHIEPPREVVVLRADVPDGMESSTGNTIRFTVLEGICDRDPLVQAALHATVKSGAPEMATDDCQDITTDDLATIKRFLFQSAGSAFDDPELKQGDFAGMTNVEYFEISGIDLRDAEFEEGLFADFLKVTDMYFNDVYASSIPANTFRGVNPGMKFLEWAMNPPSEGAVDNSKFGIGGIDHLAFRGLDSLSVLYVGGFTTSEIDHRVFQRLSNLRYLEIEAFPQFNGPFKKDHFQQLKKLEKLIFYDMNLDDDDFPNKMLVGNPNLTNLVFSGNKLTDNFRCASSVQRVETLAPDFPLVESDGVDGCLEEPA